MDLNVRNAVLEQLHAIAGGQMEFVSARPLGGGSINAAYELQTTKGSFFVKHNRADLYPAMFEREAEGLELIRSAGAIRIPEVVMTGETESQSYIVLEFLQRGRPAGIFWETFGHQLAVMHRKTAPAFGEVSDNYMGSLPQSNQSHSGFVSFFVEERILPQLELAAGALSHLRPAFEELFVKLPEIIPREQPSLVHGDLWSGNFLVGPEGEPCLIDPAVYYGHREHDIAMTRLFGGFDDAIYEAYNAAFPLQPGWRERIDLFNLYPLLVHVNLFGGGYIRQVETIVRNYV